MSRKYSIQYYLAAAALLFSACAPAALPATAEPTPGITRQGRLTPFVSISATPSPTVTQASTPTMEPSATPTPRTHIVKAGEDLGGIAYQYHVTVPDLIKANPTINPRAMSVGITLVIPPSKTNPSSSENETSAPAQGDAVPTPIPLESGPVSCWRSQDGGVWCFQPVLNHQSITLEGVSAQFTLSSAGQEPVQVTANLPLDLLPPDASLPLVANIPPEQAAQLAQPLHASSQVVSALPSEENNRYLPAHVEDAQVMIAADGLSASISLKVRLDLQNTRPGRVWVAAVAYDAQGLVTGVRRWENTSASPLESGKALDVRFSIYSVAAKIERVELFPEARP